MTTTDTHLIVAALLGSVALVIVAVVALLEVDRWRRRK